MTPKHCDEHSNNCHRLARLEMRMDRLELAIVGGLLIMIAQLWMLWDLPGRLKGESSHIVAPAHAEGMR